MELAEEKSERIRGVTMKRKHRLTGFMILSVLVLCFIFSNSLQGPEVSNAKSSTVAALLRPLFDLFLQTSDTYFHFLIRKLAHFTEFALLGICLSGVAVHTTWEERCRWMLPIGGSFMAAVVDETIQRFTGRTSMFKDVLIDFSGAVFGIGLVLLWLWVKRCCRNTGQCKAK